MKLLLNFVFLIGFSPIALAAVGQISVKGGAWSYSTENVRATNDSESGVGAYAVEVGYAISPSWLTVFGVNLVMSDVVSGSAGFGFDLGAKYFFLTQATTSEFESENVSVSISETFRPYAGLFMRQRTFGLRTSVSYMGPGITIGTDYRLSSRWLLNAEARYDYLYGQGDALAKQTNFLVGLGFEF